MMLDATELMAGSCSILSRISFSSLLVGVHTKKCSAEYWDAHYLNFLEPLINSCNGVNASRSTALRQDIQRQIVNDLFSDIVLADLTDANVNVYWELGVRLSFRHGTITIADENKKIPFDISKKAYCSTQKSNPKGKISSLDNWSNSNESGKWLIEKEGDMKQTLAVYQQSLYKAKEKMIRCC